MKHYQTGASMLSIIIIIAVVGFILTFAIKAVPPYIDNMYVQDALKTLVKDHPNLKEMGKSEINGALSRYMTINTVSPVAEKSFEIKRFGDHFLVNSVYEVRNPLFANIDLVIKFENQLDISKPDKCCKFLVKDKNEK